MSGKKDVSLLFLGTGTSTGVPTVGCPCHTCKSNDPHDKRLRSSVLLSWEDGGVERNVLVDTSTDLRYQSLKYKISHIDSVLYTHPHADHIHGIDELRCFNFIQKSSIPCYGSAQTLGRIRTMFDYIFNDSQAGGGKPKLTTHTIENDFALFGREIITLPAKHGEMDVLGFRVGNLAYLTDCNLVPESTIKKMSGLDILVLGAVQIKSHSTHFSVDEALEVAEKIGAKRTLLTHMNHQINHEELSAKLPKRVELAYDGLTLNL